MQASPHDWIHLDDRGLVGQADLACMCRLSPAEVDELVDYGALSPLAAESPAQRMFRAAVVPLLREATDLRERFDLDLFTVGLVLGYLQRIQHLEQQLRSLEVHLPHALHPVREGPAPWQEPHARG